MASRSTKQIGSSHYVRSVLSLPESIKATLNQPDVIDIITVDDQHYAIVNVYRVVPGCTVVPASQLHAHLGRFLTQGFSQRYRAPYGELAGITGWTLISYSLEKLSASHKQQFSHALSGTATRTGMIETWQGRKLGRGAFIVPNSQEGDVLSFLGHWKIDYTRDEVLRAR